MLGLRKRDLLSYLARSDAADANAVARAFGVHYSVAAMGLLRLVRQGLATRDRAAAQGLYRYRPQRRRASRVADDSRTWGACGRDGITGGDGRLKREVWRRGEVARGVSGRYAEVVLGAGRQAGEPNRVCSDQVGVERRDAVVDRVPTVQDLRVGWFVRRPNDGGSRRRDGRCSDGGDYRRRGAGDHVVDGDADGSGSGTVPSSVARNCCQSVSAIGSGRRVPGNGIWCSSRLLGAEVGAVQHKLDAHDADVIGGGGRGGDPAGNGGAIGRGGGGQAGERGRGQAGLLNGGPVPVGGVGTFPAASRATAVRVCAALVAVVVFQETA